MGSKLLFVMGIVLAHGAVGAAWMRQDAPHARTPVSSCVNSPLPMPYFQPQRELLAHVVTIRAEEQVQP
jgi:hypothetical protein